MKTNKNIGVSLEEIKKKLLADPETKSAYEELEPDYGIIRQIIKARIEQNLTQTELAEKNWDTSE